MSRGDGIGVIQPNVTAMGNNEFAFWFKGELDRLQVTCDYRGNFRIGSESIGLRNLSNKLFLAAKNFNRKFSRDEIDSSLELLYYDYQKSLLAKLRLKMRQVQPSQELERFVTAIMGRPDPLTVKAMGHFIWQVKRKLFRMPVTDHMMPVLVGAQRSGKSTAVRKLLEPLNELYLNKTLFALADQREWSIFHDYPVIVVDEMAQAERTCMETLKMVISDEFLSYRMMRTNFSSSMPNISTLIGTSNYTLDMLLKDPTGNRRFFQIQCPEQMDWETINAIDYDKLWASIDAEKPSPLADAIWEIQTAQSTYAYKNTVQTWLEASDACKTKEGRTSADLLWDHYCKWCEDAGIKPFDKLYFSKILAQSGYERTRLGRLHKKARGFYLIMPTIPFEPTPFDNPSKEEVELEDET